MKNIILKAKPNSNFGSFADDKDDGLIEIYESDGISTGSFDEEGESRDGDENGKEFDLENNLYLVGVLDQDLINGWEVWVAGLTSKERASDFTNSAFNDILEKYLMRQELENSSDFAMDGNVASKPPMRRSGEALKPGRKRGLCLVSRRQWKSLAHFMSSFQSNIVGGAETLLKKIFHIDPNGSCSWTSLQKDYNLSESSSATVLKKWISVKGGSDSETDCSSKKNKCWGDSRRGSLANEGRIRVEVKAENQNGEFNLVEDDESLKLMPNDTIRIKATMFHVTLNIYQMEVDLVQSFVCTTLTDRCRRRIAKVVKREIIPEINWEKGVNAAGYHFAVHLSRFDLPELSPIEHDEHQKFNLRDLEYELRVRFFSDDEIGQTVASACSFPLVIMQKEEAEDGDDEEEQGSLNFPIDDNDAEN